MLSAKGVTAGEGASSGRGTLLTLVRHGETDWNLQRRIQGSTDVPLNDTGRDQAATAGESIALAGYSRVYASPQVRALETARIIAAASDLDDPDTHVELREREFGPAEGMTGDEIAENFPDGIPGQETRDAVVERALPVLLHLADRHEGEAIVVVTHGAVIGSIVRRITGGERPEPGEPIFNLSLTHLEVAGGMVRLGRFNVPAESLQEAVFPQLRGTPSQRDDPQDEAGFADLSPATS
ncbi:phosphatase PhoE [Humibacter soli]